MSGWTECTLGEVITLQRGFDLTQREATPGPFPVISSGGVSYTTENPKVSGPGVVTGRKGVLGKVHFSSGPYWPHDTTLWVKDFKDSVPRFIYYLLQTVPLASLDVGASNPTLNRNHAHLLPVRVPAPGLQPRIAHLLGALDDLIENDRRRIELLERMAQAIYREWFVHFRYPGHDDANFVDSELGRIPAGWGVATLGEAGRWLSGGTPRTSVAEYWDGEIPWITSGTLTSMLLDRSERMVTQAGLENGTRIVNRDALLFVVRGMSLVKEFRVGIADVAVAFGQDCKAVIANDDFEALFLAFEVICRASEIQGMVELAGHGTGKLSTDRLKAIMLPRPNIEVQRQFVELVEPLRDSMTAVRLSADRLADIRSVLLPRLVTGQIDVSDLDLDAVAESVA